MSRAFPAVVLLMLGLAPIAAQCAPQAARQDASPTISGSVVDEHGKPVDLVYVLALPFLRGGLVRRQTDEDGRFVLPVAPDCAFLVTIEVEDPPPDAKPVRSGEAGIDLVLPAAQRWSFVVLDDASGAPLERYGLGVVNGPRVGIHGGIDFEEVELRDHRRGEATSHAVSARHVVRVQAPGYAPVEAKIVADPEEGLRQTIRMQTGGTLAGRVTANGAALAKASVLAMRGPIPTGWPRLDEVVPDGWFLADYPRDLSDYVGRPRTAETTAEGTFAIGDLASGTYDVLVRAPSLGPKKLARVRVAAGGTRDLGEIALAAPASVHVRVLVGANASAHGMQFAVDEDWHGRRTLGAEGSVLVEGLGAGVHRINLQRNASLAQNEIRDVRLEPGDRKEVVFDLSRSAPCRLAMRVTQQGSPFAAGAVQAAIAVHAKFNVHATLPAPVAEDIGSLLKTNEPGRFSGEMPGGSEVRFSVLGENRLVVGRAPARPAPAGGELDVEIEVEPGSLELVLPESIEVPEYGEVDVLLKRGDEQVQSFTAKTERSPLRYGGPIWSSRRCDVGPLEPGEYWMQVTAKKETLGPDGIAVVETTWLVSLFRTNCVVVAHERTTIEVTR